MFIFQLHPSQATSLGRSSPPHQPQHRPEHVHPPSPGLHQRREVVPDGREGLRGRGQTGQALTEEETPASPSRRRSTAAGRRRRRSGQRGHQQDDDSHDLGQQGAFHGERRNIGYNFRCALILNDLKPRSNCPPLLTLAPLATFIDDDAELNLTEGLRRSSVETSFANNGENNDGNANNAPNINVIPPSNPESESKS